MVPIPTRPAESTRSLSVLDVEIANSLSAGLYNAAAADGVDTSPEN